MANYHKILVMHTGGIGDLIMAVPALRTLRHACPKSTIHFLGAPKSVKVVHNLPYFNEIITMDTVEIKKGFLRNKLKTIKFIWFLRKQKYNILFVLQPQMSFGASMRMGLFAFALEIPERFGRDTNGRGFFLTKTVNETSSSKRHEVERMLDVIRLIGTVPENDNLEIHISLDDREAISELLKHNGISLSVPLIALAPGFGKSTRRWYPGRWAQLGDRLVNKYGVNVVLIGGPKEVELSTHISNLMKEQPFVVAGETTITQSAALLEQTQLVITNDSGPMHLAAAVGANIVALFGPGDCNRIKPYTDSDKFVIVSKKAYCAPCYKVECKDHKCMRDITVDDVYNAVLCFYKDYLLIK